MTRAIARRFHEFRGQPRLVGYFRRVVRSCKGMGEAVPHHLFFAAPGMGKSAFARAVAEEYGSRFVELPPHSSLEKAAELLRELDAGDILFLDEAHSSSSTLQDFLLRPLEDFLLPWGESVAGFTFIAATTRPSGLRQALRSRMRKITFDSYRPVDLREIAEEAAAVKERQLSGHVANRLANLPAATPRRIVQFVQDLLLLSPSVNIGVKHLETLFVERGIDALGLEPHHRLYLNVLRDSEEGVCSVSRLALALGYDDSASVRQEIEHLLLQLGLIELTGAHLRRLTEKGHELFNTSNGHSSVGLIDASRYGEINEEEMVRTDENDTSR